MSKFSSIISQEHNTIVVPGVFDAISAKLAELNFFKMAWVSGFSVSSSLFMPDNNSLSIDKYIDRIYEIRDVSNIPLIIDCDEGFGDMEQTVNLFTRLNKLKVECCCIEDNVYPKINSFKESLTVTRELKSTEHFSRNISILKREFPEIYLIARTESLIAGEDLESAVERAHSYRSAGADLIVIHSKSRTYTEFQEIVKAYGDANTLVIIPTFAENMLASDFNELGIKIVIYANQILRRYILTINNTLQLLSNNVNIDDLNKTAVSMNYIFNLIDNPKRTKNSNS